jgi:hypothetical protein
VPFRVFKPNGIGSLVQRSHFAVWTTLWFSRSTEPPRRLSTRQLPLVGFHSPSKFVPSVTSPDPRVEAPLMGSCPLQHIKTRRSGPHGRCLPATFRPQGLTSLSTVFALRAPARHVSGERRSWGLPFGGSLSRKVTRPLDQIEPTRRSRHDRSKSKLDNRPRRPTSGL